MNDKGTKSSLFYYGWVIITVSFVTMFVGYASRFAFGVFLLAILHDFGWSRGSSSLAFSINLATYATTAPVVGMLVDKFGARKVVPLGALLLGLTLVGCTRMSTLWHFYFLFGLAGAGTCAIGSIPHTSIIPNWFVRTRGLAMGIANAGITLSMMLTLAAHYIMETFNWQGVFYMFALLAILVAAPLSGIFLRQSPENKDPPLHRAENCQMLSDAEDGVPRAATVYKERALRETMTNYRFLILLLMNLFYGACMYPIVVHQVVYITDLGYTSAAAATIAGLFGVWVLAGNVSSSISDRLGREVTYTIGCIVASAGLLTLMLTQDPFSLWMLHLYILLFGFGCGLIVPTSVAASADIFRGKHFGLINSLIIAAALAGGSVGSYIAGRIFDVTGSYVMVFRGMYLLLMASTTSLWLAAPRKGRIFAAREGSPS